MSVSQWFTSLCLWGAIFKLEGDCEFLFFSIYSSNNIALLDNVKF